jgi:hypothetical protein
MSGRESLTAAATPPLASPEAGTRRVARMQKFGLTDALYVPEEPSE